MIYPSISQGAKKAVLDTPRALSWQEAKKALTQLSSDQPPGPDAIPLQKCTKLGRASLLHKLTDLFQSTWNKRVVLQQLKDAYIIHLNNCIKYRTVVKLSNARRLQTVPKMKAGL